jgi:outer membrane assembly lipoprotein YfiO
MVGIAIVFVLLMGSLVQASSEQRLTPELRSADGIIKTKELAQVSKGDTVNPAEKKEEQVKHAPVTTSIFAKKTISTMNFQELKKSKDENVKAGDKKAAIKYLERMVPICSDLEELKGIMLELAQCLYETEDYPKASKMYHEFTLLYPGSDEVEFAMYQSISSTFKLILDAEHDQSKTVEARELAQAFLDRSSFTAYKKEVEAIVLQCEERLLESEINIFNFYINRGNYVAANTRLAGIKQAYIGKTIPDIQTRLALLETSYADATFSLNLQQATVVAVQDKEAKTELIDKKTV